MKVKIKNISISGIRGAKSDVVLPLNGKSIVLYGDNGTGKSSIADAVEWYYTNRVEHLSSNSEIDLKDALRNASLNDEDISDVSISYIKETALDASKTLAIKRNKLEVGVSNTSEEYTGYIENSKQENLLLRYQYLTDFIDNTKSDN